MNEVISDFTFWLLIAWIFGPAIICYIMALDKHRNTLIWVLAGMVFGVFTIIVLYFLPKLPGKVYNIPKDNKIDRKLKLFTYLKEIKEAKSNKSNIQ